MSEKYIINEDDLRYKIKIGRYGSYFYDSKLEKDMDLEETRWILNQFEKRKDLFYESQELISEFVNDLKSLLVNYPKDRTTLNMMATYTELKLEKWEEKIK